MILTTHSVTNYSLSIEQHFENNDSVVKVDDSTFVYYNKLSSKNQNLEVAIHLLSEDGNISKCTMPKMKLGIKLVYEDGIPVPIMPIKPLKLARQNKDDGIVPRSDKPILCNLDCKDPELGGTTNSTVFRFFLEEVSYHHHGHDGYKLRVSVQNLQNIVIHPAVMKELIVVLSKPRRISQEHESFPQIAGCVKNVDSKTFLIQKRETFDGGKSSKRKLSNPIQDHDASNKVFGTKRIKVEGDISFTNPSNNGKSCVQISDILQAYRFNGVCFKCRSSVDIKKMLQPEYHADDCAFTEKLLPLFHNVDISKLTTDSESIAEHMVKIMDTKSFEETCKKHIEKSPVELIDANIFTADGEDDTSNSSVKSDHDSSGQLHPTSTLSNEISSNLLPFLLLDSKHPTIQRSNIKVETLSSDEFDDSEISPTMAIITGQNIFRSKQMDNRPNDHDDFLSFLDHIAKDENDATHVHDSSLESIGVKTEPFEENYEKF
jgi:hypothetical protein